jgi:hypothetical protein
MLLSGPSIERPTFRASIAPGILMPQSWGEPVLSNNEEAQMTIASDLLQRHIQTLVDDNTQWQTLIADDVLW